MARRSLKSSFTTIGIYAFIGYKAAFVAAPDTMLGKAVDSLQGDDAYRECVGLQYKEAIENGFSKNPISKLIATARIRDFCLKQFPG